MTDQDLWDSEHKREIERKRQEKKARKAEILRELNTTAQMSGVEGSPSSPPAGVSPAPSVESAEEGGVFDSVVDVGSQVIGGAFDGLDSMLNLPFELAGGGEGEDAVNVFPDIEESDSTVGQLARGAAQFGVGFVPGLSVLKTLNYATKGMKALKGARALAASKPLLGSIAKGAAAGAVADFAAFNGNEGRLTDILADVGEEHPQVNALVFDYLRSDPDDSAIEGRFKNTLEGLLIGGVADTALVGLGKALKNVKFLEGMNKKALEERTPAAVQSVVRDKADRLLTISQDSKDINDILDYVNKSGLSKEELDAADFSRMPGETVEDAAARLNVKEHPALVALRERDPEMGARAEKDMAELTKLKEEYDIELENARKDWMEVRTGEGSDVLDTATWNEWDEKMNLELTDNELGLIDGWNKAGKAEKTRIIEANKGLKREEDLARTSARIKTLPKWNDSTKGWDADGDSFWEGIKREGRIDAVDTRRLKESLKNQDAVSAAEIANKYDILLETKLPKKGQSTADFLRENELFKGVITVGKKSSLAGKRLTGKAQTNKWTEAEGAKFAKSVADNSDVKSLLENSDGATVESLVDFARFMDDKIDLSRAPQIFTGVRQILFEMRTSLIQTSKAIDAGTADDLATAQFLGMAEMVAEITDAYSGNMARIAQTLQSGGISPKSGNNDWYFAMKDRLASTDAADVKKLAAIISSAGDAATINRVSKAFTKGGKFWESVAEAFTNSVLSGPMTTVVNTLSGVAQTIYIPLEAMAGAAIRLDLQGVRTEMQAFKALVDASRGLVRISARSMELPEKSMGTTPWLNTKKAWKEQAGQLDARTSFDEAAGAIDSGNYEMQQGTWASAMVNAVGNVVRTPGRVMLTVDEMAKGLNYNMRLSRNAYEEGMEKGVTDINEYVSKYMTDSTNWDSLPTTNERHLARQQHDEALEYARRATFQEDLHADSFAKSIQKFTSKHPSMRLVLPFVRTPANLMKFVGQRTPGLNRISKEVQEDLAAGSVRAQAVRDRMNVATLLWSTAMVQAGEGVITGAGPKDLKERQAWYDTGWQPYSIYTGVDENGKATWVSYRKGDPLGMFLGVTADLADAFTNIDINDPSATELAAAGFYALMENIKSRSYFTGATQLLNAFDNPERLGERYFNSMLGNVVPNLLSQSRRYGPIGNDDAMREVNGLWDTIQNRIPGLSYGLAPKRNLYGEITKYPTGVGPDILNPFHSAKNSITPETLKALKQGTHEFGNEPKEDRPAMAAVQIGYSFNMSRFDNVGEIELSPEQRDRWIQLTGPPLKEALIRLVSAPGWELLSDPVPGAESESGKYKVFADTVQAYKDRARNILMQEDEALREAERAAQQEKLANQTFRQDSSLL